MMELRFRIKNFRFGKVRVTGYSLESFYDQVRRGKVMTPQSIME